MAAAAMMMTFYEATISYREDLDLPDLV